MSCLTFNNLNIKQKKMIIDILESTEFSDINIDVIQNNNTNININTNTNTKINEVIYLPIKIYFDVAWQYFTIKFMLDLLKSNDIIYEKVDSINDCDVWFLHSVYYDRDEVDVCWTFDDYKQSKCHCKLVVDCIPYENEMIINEFYDDITVYDTKTGYAFSGIFPCNFTSYRYKKYHYATDTVITNKDVLIANASVITEIMYLREPI